MSFRFKKLTITPRQARIYLFLALVLLAAPTILYKILPSHAGQILVAAGASRDQNFSKTILYMAEHHGYGATGYIINKPLDDASITLLQRIFPFAARDQFYFGGPVATNSEIFFLIPEDEDFNAIKIVSVKTLQENPDQYNVLINDPFAIKNLRILSGYAGWYGFQLNKEIVLGGWDVIPYDGRFLKGLTQEESWKAAVDKVLEEKSSTVEVL